MAASGRRKLFEVLNRAKAELDEKKAELDEQKSESSSVVSAASHSNSTLNGIQSLPRGAGRARLFRPELLNKPHPNGIAGPSSRASTPTHSEIASVNSDRSSDSNASEIKEQKRGTKGNTISLAVNYIPIKCQPDVSIFEYEVRYEPNMHSNQIRRSLLASVVKPVMPVFTFDGASLYLPRKLPENTTIFKTNNRNDGTPIEITIIFRRQKPMKECIHFYNVLFKQVMLRLEYVQFGQKMFDPTEPKNIPHRKLTIWPGYALACDQYDEGLMLMLDTSHRVLFDSRVSDLLRRIRMSCDQNPSQNFKDLVLKSLYGAVVLTPYNNKTYTIHEIDFEQTPMSKFKVSNDREVTYVEYYKTIHGVDIEDLNQPLLISYKDRKMIAKNGQVQQDQMSICLIPELAQLTGLTDEMRKDNMVMRDIASCTRVTPNQRVEAARKYIAKVNETPSAREILDKWGLRLSDHIFQLEGRQLPGQEIKFGGDKSIMGVIGDFQVGSDILFEVVDLHNWIIMYTKQDNRCKEEFLNQVERCATGMGLHWKRPYQHMLPDDRTETYAIELRKLLQLDTQMVVFICPTSRDDRYATIKKICCSEKPVASQVINSRTLANPQRNRSVVQKILMQMNCKLGGSLWSIKIPFKNVMICGTDTYHNTSQKADSVAAFVASLNGAYTKWYSKATIQSKREELSHGLCVSMKNALSAYEKHNGVYPDRIVLYRDGVGDGQFTLCKQFEIPQIKAACRLVDKNYNPDITFIIVQKRVNTRIFAIDRAKNNFDNAPPGTVLDHSITRRGLFDFYLVSQKMRHGTVTPSHYVVIENECNLSADILQQLSYKLTYQYFNWPGSIRVPAPCQYAHKLAYLVGESIKRETAEKLEDKLFYL